MITLTVEKRDAATPLKSVRAAGGMPAIVYGPKHNAEAVTLSCKAFEKALKEAGESSVLELSGLGAPVSALIHDVDYDPVTSVPRHVDFYAVEKGAKVEVAVPLTFTGESQAVKHGANLVKVLHEVEVEAEATNLPHEITVDVSALAEVDDQIHAKDLALPKGVTLVTGADEVIALAQEVKEEAEGEGPDMDAIEVAQKGKAEEAAAE